MATDVVKLFRNNSLVFFIFRSSITYAITVLRIMSFSILFVSLSNIYGTNYMIIQGYAKQLRSITFVCSAIGFIMSLPLVYYFDFIGAAITITLSKGILGGECDVEGKIDREIEDEK